MNNKPLSKTGFVVGIALLIIGGFAEYFGYSGFGLFMILIALGIYLFGK